MNGARSDMVGGGIQLGNSRWTREEDKQFETYLVEFKDDFPNRWETIAAMMGSKSSAEVERHYAVLIDDIMAIEAGTIEVPDYPDMENKQAVVPRKVARPWSDEEHQKFLEGLELYGKGDWKSISRYCVMTRNPAQVASHAQKYYERQEKEAQDRKRRSIFDSSIGGGKGKGKGKSGKKA